MAVTANQAIASWNIKGHTLYARTWDNGETFWLCQQVTGTPGGTDDTFVVREPHMLAGLNLTWLSGYTSITGPALAAEFKKHIYPGETVDTTTRTVSGLGNGYPVNFPVPAGYAKTTNGEPEYVKANTAVAKKETAASTAKVDAAGNPVTQTFFQKFKYYIIGGAVAVVGGVIYFVTRKKKGGKRS